MYYIPESSKSTITYEEFQSLCLSHIDDDINVDDVLHSISVRKPAVCFNEFAWLYDAMKDTNWNILNSREEA